MIARVNVVLNRTVVDSDWCFDNLFVSYLQCQSELYHLDDNYCTGWRNVRYSQQQSYSGLRTPGRSYSTWMTPQFKSFSNKRDTYPIISLPPQSVQLLLLLGVSYVVEPIWPSITATINSKASSSVNVPNTMKATCLKKKEIKKTMWFNRYLEICCT